MKERVTVCLCAYNHEKYIRQALDRLAEQTFQDFKIIACDDGSSDHTYQILKEYESGRLAGKLKVITHPDHKNKGIYHSYDLCLEHVNTEFFIGHASDDFLNPDALQSLVNVMENNPQADFAYGPCNAVDEKGENLKKIEGAENIGCGLKAIKKLLTGNVIREPSIFYRKTCKSLMKIRPPHLVYADWFMNVILFSEAQPLYYVASVVNYRTHAQNISRSVDAETHRKRSASVFLELAHNKKIIENPEIKTFVRLACSGLVPEKNSKSKNKEGKKEIKNLLNQIPTSEARNELVWQNWVFCSSFGNSYAHNILPRLPNAEKINVLARQNLKQAKQAITDLHKRSGISFIETLEILFCWVFGKILNLPSSLNVKLN